MRYEVGDVVMVLKNRSVGEITKVNLAALEYRVSFCPPGMLTPSMAARFIQGLPPINWYFDERELSGDFVMSFLGPIAIDEA